MVEMTSSFELEIKTLDEDHQNLINLANKITDDIDKNDAVECSVLVPRFVKLSKQHFLREEALLVKAGYPNVQKHHDHHAGLNDKMDHMVEFSSVAANNPIAGESLKKELMYFIMDDVITSDMEFKDFMKLKENNIEKESKVSD